MILTEEIRDFREAARHLWNTYLKRDADWDTVDAYNEICLRLFETRVVDRLELSALPIPMIPLQKSLDEYRLYANHTGKIPLLVNRDVPASGYWDYPIDWIPPEEHPDIRPISFFDFDAIGQRKIEFYRAIIVNCPSHPEINRREALIGCDDVELEFVGKQT
jgi:hypothetical protein